MEKAKDIICIVVAVLILVFISYGAFTLISFETRNRPQPPKPEVAEFILK
jgi:hypothetical protein